MMDKEKSKQWLSEAASKTRSALSEIRDNFKAGEGTTGFRKIESRFVNLWKSGTTGKGALIACSGVLLFLLIIGFCSSGKSGGNVEDPVAINKNTTKKAMADIARAQEEAAAAVRVKQEVAAAATHAEEHAAVAAARAQENAKAAEAGASNVSAAKEEIEIKDVESAKKALRAAYASGDMLAVQRAQEALTRMQNLEAEKQAELEAKELKELQAKEEAEEAARVAKAKAEREAKEAAKRAAFEAIPERLVVKGLYVGMPGDGALEACKQLVAKEGDLVVVDYRQGIDREKDEETKAKEKKDWDARVKLAETDIDLFMKWNSLGGEVYNPSVAFCEGKIPDPNGFADAVAMRRASMPGAVVDPGRGLFRDSPSATRLKWSGDRSAKIPCPGQNLASALACLAAIYGYQVEWMLPGRHSGSENAKDTEIQRVAIETLKSADFVMLGGVNGILHLARNEKFDDVFGMQLYSKVYNKGLRIHRKYVGRLLFRLVLKDSTGKPIEKSVLATEIACNFPELFKKGSSNAEMVKAAEKYVDAVSEWVDVLYERSRSSATTGNSHRNPRTSHKQQAKKTSRVIEDLFANERLYESAMEKLSNNCKASVEYAVLVEPCEKFEQVTEVFTIPASNYKAAEEFVHNMDVKRLGKNSENVVGYDGSRKRVFFKHGLEDIRSPLWFRLVPKTTNGVEVARDEIVKNWLAARGHYKPSEKVKVPPKNLIQVSINQKGVPDNKLKGLCFVWIDETGNVKETYYNAEGMNRFFDAKNLSGEEFANLLVKSYPGLPSLKMNVDKKDPGRGIIEERTWTYNCPKGYQVKLFERSYINDRGVTYYDSKMLERDPEADVALTMIDMRPDKHLSISTTKSASARKFD